MEKVLDSSLLPPLKLSNTLEGNWISIENIQIKLLRESTT